MRTNGKRMACRLSSPNRCSRVLAMASGESFDAKALPKRRPLIWIVNFKLIQSKFEIKARASLIPLMKEREPNRRRVANYSKGTNA
jgi:hypothetical protein